MKKYKNISTIGHW